MKDEDQPTPEQIVSLRERERLEILEAQRCHCRRPVKLRSYLRAWICALCTKTITDIEVTRGTRQAS